MEEALEPQPVAGGAPESVSIAEELVRRGEERTESIGSPGAAAAELW